MPRVLTAVPAAPQEGQLVTFQLVVDGPEAVVGDVYEILCTTPAAGIIFNIHQATVGPLMLGGATLDFRADAGFPAAGVYHVVTRRTADPLTDLTPLDLTVQPAVVALPHVPPVLPVPPIVAPGVVPPGPLPGGPPPGAPVVIPINVPVAIAPVPPLPVHVTIGAPPPPPAPPAPRAGAGWGAWAIPTIAGLVMLGLLAIIGAIMWSALHNAPGGGSSGGEISLPAVPTAGGQANSGGVPVNSACTSNCSADAVNINTPLVPSVPPALPSPSSQTKGDAENPPPSEAQPAPPGTGGATSPHVWWHVYESPCRLPSTQGGTCCE